MQESHNFLQLVQYLCFESIKTGIGTHSLECNVVRTQLEFDKKYNEFKNEM